MTTPEEVLAVIEEGKSGRHVSVTSELKTCTVTGFCCVRNSELRGRER